MSRKTTQIPVAITADAVAITTRSGQPAWRRLLAGPCGGLRPWYCPRAEGETAPSLWAIWSDRARDVSPGDVAGSYTVR